MRFWIVGLLLFLSGCDSADQEITVFTISFPFGDSDQEWTGDFADYPENDSATYQLYLGHDLLPQNLNTTGDARALHISGSNGNHDLFMFIKGKATGLRPNTSYELLFTVKIGSNASTTTGANVIVKAGASLVEPQKELQEGVYRMNIDKGTLTESGSDMINIGNIGTIASPTGFTMITRTNSSSNKFLITTDATGEIWLVVGTDSGFEGDTELYYTQVDVSFNQVD